jgi:hypothetical protein
MQSIGPAGLPFQGRHAVSVEDDLVTDVVIGLLISFQLSRGRMYDGCRTRRIVVATCCALSLHRNRKQQGDERR